MAITEKSIEQSQAELIEFVNAYNTERNTNIDTRIGTVFKDILVDAPSVQFNSLSQDLVTASKVFSVDFAGDETIQTEDVDHLASNWGLVRKSATSATGIQEFITTKEPTTDIIINAGVIVATKTTEDVPELQYQVTETVILPVSNKNAFKITENGIIKYRISAAITAVTTGSVGNVGSLTITELKQPVSGIETTRNAVATTGGADIESNTSLADRIKLKLTGNNIGTENGIKSLMLENSDVKNVSVVRPGDPELARNQFGGAVDVYIDGQNISTFEEDRQFFAAIPEIILSRQPAAAIISIVGVASGDTKTFIQGTDFNFVLDSSTLHTGSIRVKNKIVFDIGGTNPDDGSFINITYTYNKLIVDLQTEIDSTENNLITSDILIKEAVRADIDMSFSVTLLPGFTKNVVVQAIKDAVTNFIDLLPLGTPFNRSDIIGIVENVEGVDSIDTDSLIIQKNSILIPDQKIPIRKFEFAELITIDIFII